MRPYFVLQGNVCALTDMLLPVGQRSDVVVHTGVGRKMCVPGDPKGEWTTVSRAVGGQAVELGGGLPARLNPLDEGMRAGTDSDGEWLTTVRARRRDLVRSIAEVALARELRSVEITALLAALDAAVRDNTIPTLPRRTSSKRCSDPPPPSTAPLSNS